MLVIMSILLISHDQVDCFISDESYGHLNEYIAIAMYSLVMIN